MSSSTGGSTWKSASSASPKVVGHADAAFTGASVLSMLLPLAAWLLADPNDSARAIPMAG